MNSFLKRGILLAAAPIVLAGCASTGESTWNHNWKVCSAVGAGAGALAGSASSTSAMGWGAVGGAVVGGLVCALTDKDSDGDGVMDSKDECPDTPKGLQVDEVGCPLAGAEDMTIVMSGKEYVRFHFDSAELTDAYKQELEQLAPTLSDAEAMIVVTGHTDSIGAEAYNQDLSERRAASVHDYLVSQGVADEKISPAGKGESSPIADNSTEEGRSQNRRVEVFVDY